MKAPAEPTRRRHLNGHPHGILRAVLLLWSACAPACERGAPEPPPATSADFRRTVADLETRGLPHLARALRRLESDVRSSTGGQAALAGDFLAALEEPDYDRLTLAAERTRDADDSPEEARRLVAALRLPFEMERSLALEALKMMGSDASPVAQDVADFLAMTESEDERLQGEATLIAIGEKSIPSLAGLLSSPEESVRRHAADALARLDGATGPAVEPLRRALEDPSREMRWLAAAALLRRGLDSGKTLPLVEAAALEGDDKIRLLAISMLFLVKDEHPLRCALLVRALGDTQRSVRGIAANALGSDPGRCLSHVLAGAVDENPYVRLGCAVALGHVENPTAEVIDALAKLAKDADRSLEEVEASIELTAAAIARTPEFDAHALRREWSGVRGNAIESLGRLGRAAVPALPVVISALEDSEPLVQILAAMALRTIGVDRPDVREALEEASSSSDATVGKAARDALEALGESETERPVEDAGPEAEHP